MALIIGKPALYEELIYNTGVMVENMVIFRCLCDGQCCKRYWIPITHLDMLRLQIYGNINIDVGIVEFKEKDNYDLGDLYPPIKIRGREFYLALASKEDEGCVFLHSDGKCSVHEFKPLVCRFYPFVYWVKEDGDIGIDINEKAINECPGLIVDDKPIPSDIVENLKRIARIRIEELRLWSNTILEWNSMYRDDENKDFKKFLEFSLEKAKKHMEDLLARGMWIM